MTLKQRGRTPDTGIRPFLVVQIVQIERLFRGFRNFRLNGPALGAVSAWNERGFGLRRPRPDTAPATGPPPRALGPEPMFPALAPHVDGDVGGNYHAVNGKPVLRLGVPGHRSGL